MSYAKKDIIDKLRSDLLKWEGYQALPTSKAMPSIGLGQIENAFPNQVFPLGMIHEFICANIEQASASGAFVSALIAQLMQENGICLWISLSGDVFPTALPFFGLNPDRVIFVHLPNEKEVFWILEEALRCKGLTAVIGEVRTLDFKQSRRFQLAVEQSGVTGFIMRNQPKKANSTACAARWQIAPLPSNTLDDLPGVGYPRWQIELLKARNGKPGTWTLEWHSGTFNIEDKKVVTNGQLMVG
jgi:protein ImuA